MVLCITTSIIAHIIILGSANGRSKIRQLKETYDPMQQGFGKVIGLGNALLYGFLSPLESIRVKVLRSS